MSSASASNVKTVEYRAINNYSRTVNTLGRSVYDNVPEYKELMSYVSAFKLKKEDPTKANVTAPSGRYLIKNSKAPKLFELLDRCYRKNVILHFRELQANDPVNKIGSGIMFDFDIYQKTESNPLENKSLQKFCKLIMLVLAKMLEGDIDTYIAVIRKPKVKKDDIKDRYKNGIHVLIPNIKVTRPQKKIIIQELLNDKEVNQEFMNIFEIDMSDAFDTQCASVPVYFLHNCKEESPRPYILKEVYTFQSDGSTSISNESLSTLPSGINLELSLNFEADKDKTFYEFKPMYQARLQIQTKKSADIEAKYEEAEYAFNHYNSYVEDNLDYYKTLVMNVLDQKRAEDRKMWRDAVFAIANIDKVNRPAYKNIAKMFSMRCQDKYDEESFEKLWNDALSERNNLSMKSLIYWCRQDDIEKFNSVLDKNIVTTIEDDVFSRENHLLDGSLYEYHFAYYIYHLFNQKFIFDVEGERGRWYEFVLESDPHRNGEVYKWRLETRPNSLILYLSNRMPHLISRVVEKAYGRIGEAEKDKTMEYVESRTTNLKTTSRKLYSNGFKTGVIKEAESLFNRRGFIDSLDEAENVMGVANGVLVLDNNVRLCTGYHSYPVSLYSEVGYYPLDLKDETTVLLIKSLMDLFPDDEIDMFHYLMYFLATCLDNRPKDSIFLILQGAGCNGKSSLLELAKTVLGKYGAKVSMATLTDQKRTTASSANEQMMAFHRARLAFYSETNKQEEINCAIVKEYTSQESITARGIYQKQRTFRPKCNHVITTNFYPVIKTTDYGIWRRMKLYKFKITFVPREPENKYERKADERVAKEFAYNEKIKEAFLSLLVEYYKDLQKTHGGKLSNVKSKSLEKDSLEYRNSMDTLNRFMCCSVVYSKDCKTLLNEVVEAYINFLVEEYGKQTNIQKNEIKQLIQNSDMNTYISGNVLNNIRLIDPTDTEDKLSKDERFLTGKTVKLEEDTFDYSTMDPLGLNSWISTA